MPEDTSNRQPDRIQAVVFDWAGTLVDFGSFAPTQVLVEAFKAVGLHLSLEQARGPMGMGKWDHIKALCALPEISDQFRSLHQRDPSDEDVTAIYEGFLPLQEKRVADYSRIIPGAIETLAWLRNQDIRIGSCSGYPRQILSKVVQQAAEAGLVVDHHVASDEVHASRPWPGMIFKNLLELDTRDIRACVKVDDTPVGIMEGHRAGSWTVALLMSGNTAGLTQDEYEAMPEGVRARIRHHAVQAFQPTNPHFCIDTVAQLPAVITTINAHLLRGLGTRQVGDY